MHRALRRRAGAWILLATFAVALGSSQVSASHFGLVDAACGDVGLAAGDLARLGTAVDGPDDEHCPVCHFMRVVGRAAVGEVPSLAIQETGVLLGLPPAAVPVTRTAPTCSSRGPPASLPTYVRFS